MTLLYADTSALVRAYFADEEDHAALLQLLLEGETPVVTCEVSRVELTSAVTAAERSGRLEHGQRLLDRFDADCAGDGPIALIRLRPEIVFPAARKLVVAHELRTLDAIHLAVATEEAPALGSEPPVLVTRDARQAAAALALGLAVC